jgi:hypothetical protein|tara:strand:+ start:973 stop:1311 length:339 start_codon:yes stop_codon:yes gene_type:complete
MSHFAEIDKDGIVQQVIVAEQDIIDSGLVGDSSNWVQTSYNNKFRKQYAGKGYTYDKTNDVFIKPQPFPSWTLDDNFDWQPSTAMPDNRTINYHWNEDTQTWDKVQATKRTE